MRIIIENKDLALKEIVQISGEADFCLSSFFGGDYIELFKGRDDVITMNKEEFYKLYKMMTFLKERFDK